MIENTVESLPSTREEENDGVRGRKIKTLSTFSLYLYSDWTPSFALLGHWPKTASLITNGNKAYS